MVSRCIMLQHFFGVFSNVNPNIVEDVKIYKNAFPAEYGGRTASVIDISSKDNTRDVFTGMAEANYLNTSAYLDVPFGKRLNLMLGGRLTNQNVANTRLFGLLEKAAQENFVIRNQRNGNTREAQLLTTQSPNFTFHDVNAKLNWEVSSDFSLTASYFNGEDEFSYNYEELISLNNSVDTLLLVSNNEITNWNNQGASFQLNKKWNNKFSTALNLSHFEYDLNSQLSAEIERNIDSTIIRSQTKSNLIKGSKINLSNTYDLTANQQLNFGYQLTKNDVDFTVVNQNNNEISVNKEATQHSFYTQWNGSSRDKKWNYSLGARATHYSGTERFYFSPRLRVGFRPSDGFQLKAAASRYYQFLRQNFREDRFGRSYEFWSLATHDPEDYKFNVINPNQYPTISSNHFMLGFSWINDFFTLDIEGYQKKSSGVIEQAQIEVSTDRFKNNPDASRIAFVNF